jgi:hypothetical protein
MGSFRVDLDEKGLRAILNGADVRADLERRAARVVAAAGPGHKSSVQQGHDRLRAAVWTDTPAAKKAEADNHSLIRALGAGG